MASGYFYFYTNCILRMIFSLFIFLIVVEIMNVDFWFYIHGLGSQGRQERLRKIVPLSAISMKVKTFEVKARKKSSLGQGKK